MDKSALENAKSKLTLLIQEGLDNKIISENEFNNINPEGKSAAISIVHLKYTRNMNP